MASTGTKSYWRVRDPLALSVDQLVCSTEAENQKTKPKVEQSEHISYDDRLKLAREKLLKDLPDKPQTKEVINKSKPEPINKPHDASYDARLKNIREKLLSDQPKISWADTVKHASESTSNQSRHAPLSLQVDQIQSTPMCIPNANYLHSLTNRAKSSEQTIKSSVFELHQKESEKSYD